MFSLWIYIFSSRSPRHYFVSKIRAHVVLPFVHRSLHKDRPHKFRLQYQSAHDFTCWISIFHQDRHPEKVHFKYQCARDFRMWDSTFSSRSPRRNFVQNIVTSPPSTRNTEMFQRCWKYFLLCKRIFPVWKLRTSPIFSYFYF